MYVRWKTHKSKRRAPLLSAVLVESHRVDGKPRQRYIKRLGSIRRKDLLSIGDLWDEVDGNLADLSPEQRRALEYKIAERFPRPDAGALAQAREERRAKEDERRAAKRADEAALAQLLESEGLTLGIFAVLFED